MRDEENKVDTNEVEENKDMYDMNGMNNSNEMNENEEMEEFEGETSSAIVKMANIIFSPTEAFKAIKAKPNWLIPLLITMFAPVVYYLVCWGQFEVSMIKEIEKQLEGSGQVMTESMMELPLTIAKVSTFVFTPIGVLIGMLFVAFIYFVVAKIVKSPAGFKQIFSMTVHIGILSVFTWLIMMVMTLIKGEMPTVAVTSLSSLLPESMDGSILSAVLAPIEVISLWSLYITFVGLRVVASLSKKAAGIIVGLSFLFGASISVITLLLANMASSMQM
ncbi:Yip1 family protein [Petrocella sp. FN5]|uniref:Yip1 family protein n=1 Tax=Petrocella sp. FN5 TaxID=3032002 RepID=UPI0023DBEEF0|nr:Yip1 family protein [Petrocella sp. FN5]MDF1618058.1 Yip1 family protein [Petrocella sp. FN5]